MNYQWINPKEITAIDAQSIVLFGAGAGSEEFLSYLKQSTSETSVVAVTDNDPTYWGKALCDYPVIPPGHLNRVQFDKIVVTSISGRENIAHQLEDMGFQRNKEFLLIGKYPKTCIGNFKRLIDDMGDCSFLKNSQCLHIGPGGFLGFEVLLYSLGAGRVSAIDKLPFNMYYPDIKVLEEEYQDLEPAISDMVVDRDELKTAHKRYHEIFARQKDGLFIDTDKIEYTYPMDICRLSFPNQSFDAVFSFSVLEHVTEPQPAIHEISRVLKPGGLSYQFITTQDHRSFSRVGGFTPFSFRSHTPEQWEQIASQRFYQNRLLPVEWKHLHEKHGLNIFQYQVECQHEITEKVRNGFHPDFQRFSNLELGEAGCRILSRKNL